MSYLALIARRALLPALCLPLTACQVDAPSEPPQSRPAGVSGGLSAAAEGPRGLSAIWSEQGDPLESDLVLTNEAEILTPGSDHSFGHAVAISGDTLLVGAPNAGLQSAGKAYFYERSGASFTLKETYPGAQASTNFGYSAAVSGNTAIVGTPLDNGGTGRAFVFERDPATGDWLKKATINPDPGDMGFGRSVAAGASKVLIGAPSAGNGGAYVFAKVGANWLKQKRLTASDGGGYDRFGQSVAMDNTTVLVGAWDHSAQGLQSSGAAYVFVESGGAWIEEQKIVPADAAAEDLLGWSVSLSGDTALIGAIGDDGGGVNAGSAYVFVREGGVWSQQAELFASDTGDEFGGTVSLSGDTAVVGDMFDSNQRGAVYVFKRSGGTWSPPYKLVSPSPQINDRFGNAISVSGGAIAVGAIKGGYDDHGAVYIIAAQGELGESCGAGAECLSGFCADGVCCETACGGGASGDCLACGAGGVCAVVPDGAPCDDSDMCTQTDACASGACVGSNPLACAALDACHVPGVCDPATGACSNPNAPDGAACDDASACTLADACLAGVCAGTPIDCSPAGACQSVACNPGTGACEQAAVLDGMPCDNQNVCDGSDACLAGQCAGGPSVVCVALDECHLAGMCDATLGCDHPLAPNGTPCQGGAGNCVGGSCIAGGAGGGGATGGGDGGASSSGTAGGSEGGGAGVGGGGSASGGGSGGAGGEAGAHAGGSADGGADGDGDDDAPRGSGCSCRTAGSSESRGTLALLALGVAVVGRRARGRRPRCAW